MKTDFLEHNCVTWETLIEIEIALEGCPSDTDSVPNITPLKCEVKIHLLCQLSFSVYTQVLVCMQNFGCAPWRSLLGSKPISSISDKVQVQF